MDVTDAGVPLIEELLHGHKVSKLKKARLDAAAVREIEKDLHWPEKSKAMLSKTGAALTAKYLNRAGVSAQYKDEVNFGVALLAIVGSEIAVNRRLNALIASAVQSQPTPAPAQTEKK